jgi:hypothetical protein
LYEAVKTTTANIKAAIMEAFREAGGAEHKGLEGQ